MGVESELTAALLEAYTTAGREVGYWATRYQQALRRNGGLATAKRMLRPRTKAQRAGLDRLLEAHRSDLTLEHIILQERFASLFTVSELTEARKRLGHFEREASKLAAERQRLYPDELQPGRSYPEGAKRHVRVNAFERNPRAREACLRHFGPICAVCGMTFAERYGHHAAGFMHVHHLKPMAAVGKSYRVDPVRDLIPVCPNCHSMLHLADPPHPVDTVRAWLANRAG